MEILKKRPNFVSLSYIFTSSDFSRKLKPPDVNHMDLDEKTNL